MPKAVRCILLGLVFWGWGFLPALYSQEAISILPSLRPTEAQIIEGESYCSTGFGSQTIGFRFNDESYQSERISEVYAPSLYIYDSPFLRIGCQIDGIILDYSFYEDSARFDETLEYEGEDYNSVEFRWDNFRIGYMFTVIPHSLHLDLGLGYAHMQYKLGYYDDNSSTSASNTSELTHSGMSAYFDIRYFLSVFVYVNWLNQQSFNETMPISYTNQLGLNFLVKL